MSSRSARRSRCYSGLEHDDLERSRYVPFILFPRPDRVTEGFSFIGHKLITTTEEHTAWRNMSADRGSMVLQTPIKRQQGALWDPQEQPFGPKAVIDVRAMNEVEPMQLPEFGLQYAEQRIQSCERTAERLAGVNDIASGQVSEESRTLGEVNMATEQSFVRIDLIVRRFQEALEDVFPIRMAIWKRTLAQEPDGVDAPASLLAGMEGRGTPIEQFSPTGKITAALLEGNFRGKPYGSVQTADPSKRRSDLMQFMQGLPMLMQICPTMAVQLQTPQAQRALFREFLQAFNVQNRQALLGSPAQDMAMTLQGQMPPGMGMPGGMGMPARACLEWGCRHPEWVCRHRGWRRECHRWGRADGAEHEHDVNDDTRELALRSIATIPVSGLGLSFNDGGDLCLGFWKQVYEAGHVPLPKHAKVLEIGCAEADWLTPMKQERNDLHLTGIDWRPCERPGASVLIQGDVLAHDFAKESFDVVVLVSALEHIGLGGYDNDPLDPDGDTHVMERISGLVGAGWTLLLRCPVSHQRATIPFTATSGCITRRP
jgi:hypothetical protein